MYTTVMQENWDRREICAFFSTFDEPYHGVTVRVNCSHAYAQAKLDHQPFYAYYLHAAMLAFNAIENFRYRFLDEKIVLFDQLDAGTTLPTAGNLFTMASIPFDPCRAIFTSKYCSIRNKLYHCKDLNLTPDTCKLDVIHSSVLPGVPFTSLSHARRFSSTDSIPKISFGQIEIIDQQQFMPVSLHVHHAFVDGYHLALFFKQFAQFLTT